MRFLFSKYNRVAVFIQQYSRSTRLKYRNYSLTSWWCAVQFSPPLAVHWHSIWGKCSKTHTVRGRSWGERPVPPVSRGPVWWSDSVWRVWWCSSTPHNLSRTIRSFCCGYPARKGRWGYHDFCFSEFLEIFMLQCKKSLAENVTSWFSQATEAINNEYYHLKIWLLSLVPSVNVSKNQ